jgi:hypothetical protein
MKRWLVLTLAAGLGWPAAVFADQPQQTVVPRFELGASAGLFTAISREGPFAIVTWGPRLSVNAGDRIGFDFVAEIISPTESGGLYGVYAVQIRHVFRPAGPRQSAIFVTGGVVGAFEYERLPERRVRRPDGSVVIYQASTDAEVTWPAGFSGGIGMRRVFGRYAAFRADAHAMFGFGGVLAVRGALGVSIPIGGSYGRTP